MSRRRNPGPDGLSPDGLSEEDARLWAQVTRSVTPLEPNEPAPEPEKGPAGPKGEQTQKKRQKTEGGRRPPPETSTAHHALEIGYNAPRGPDITVSSSGGGGLQHGDAPGVDKRTATNFRRGLMPVEASLDLHGHTRDTGRRALTAFLQGQQGAGRRCVRVVTGKGLRRAGDWTPGVLREAVPQWLNEPPLRDIVLSFTYARPDDGGSGALYVLLRRRRG